MSICTIIELKLSELEKLIELAQSGDKKTLIGRLKSKLPKGYKAYKNDKRRVKLSDIKDKAEKYRLDLINNASKAEVVFKAYLKAMGINYKFQHIFWYNRNGGLDFYIMDFYIPDYKVCVEIDGGYHTTISQKALDWDRTRIMKSNGVDKVIRFSNAQVLMEQEYVLKELSNYK